MTHHKAHGGWARAGLSLALAATSLPAFSQTAACTTDQANTCRYQADNIALARAPASERRVVFMGDSLTEGWPAAHEGLLPGGMVNRGIGGQTTAHMRARFAGDVLSLRPRVVHLMGGTNDIAGNDGKRSQGAIRNDISAMARVAQAQGMGVVLASIPPAAAFPWAPEVKPVRTIVSLNAWLKRYASQRGLVFADYYAVLATPDGALKPDYSTDGVHLNAAGYAAIEPVARAAILEAERRASVRK